MRVVRPRQRSLPPNYKEDRQAELHYTCAVPTVIPHFSNSFNAVHGVSKFVILQILWDIFSQNVLRMPCFVFLRSPSNHSSPVFL